MNNEEYNQKISGEIEQLEKMRRIATKKAGEVIGEALTREDFVFTASIDKYCRLVDGTILMLTNRNLTCAGILLRTLLDNCMRLYALYIADNPQEAIDCVLDGEKLNKLKDKNGNKMIDGYLKEQITNRFDERFSSVYDNASGYVHFSNKSFYQTIDSLEEHGFTFQIGLELPEKMNIILLECAHAFFHYSKLYFTLVNPLIESKRNLEVILADNDAICST